MAKTKRQSGDSVSSAGDVNGDGLADLIIGAIGADPNGTTPAAPMSSLANQTTPRPFELSDIAAGSGGFVIHGETDYDNSGVSVSSAGDVNGDGLADLIIGAHVADPNGISSGSSYVLFGTTETTPIELSDVAAGSGGFVINGETKPTTAATPSAAAGDINGDGLADLIIGAYGLSSWTGNTYVIFGSTSGAFYSGSNFSEIGTASADVITGTSTNDAIAAGAGDDIITANGGADVLYGGADNDTFVLNSANLHCLAEQSMAQATTPINLPALMVAPALTPSPSPALGSPFLRAISPIKPPSTHPAALVSTRLKPLISQAPATTHSPLKSVIFTILQDSIG